MIRPAAVRATLEEARSLWSELEAASRSGSGVAAVAVSGMLAEQLAKELGRGAAPGAVVARDEPRPPLAGVAVHVIAGGPSEGDVALVDAADRAGVPVVLVQLWPQADWTPPFVLSPFVVECRAGEGFPLGEIAARVVEAADDAPALAARIPVLHEACERRARREALARAAFLSALRGRRAGSRAALTLEQARLLARLDRASGGRAFVGGRETAGVAVGLLAAGVALRELARAARRALPAQVVDVAVSAGGTWALAEAYARVEDRLARRSGS